MKGKLIVLDGLDGSGKGTQSELLVKALQERGVPARLVSFPTYDEDSSAMIRSYLAGQFGSRPEDVNCYAASVFYAIDRFAGFRRYWREAYENGEIIVANRYTTANMVHQMSKLPETQWDPYLSWLAEFEYEKMEIPRPDLVIYLDMPIEVSQRLLSGRYQGDESKKDIHERDPRYLEHCRAAALYAARHQGWKRILCADGKEPLGIDTIHALVMETAEELLK